MHEAALSNVFAALADPTRRAILSSLRSGGTPVHMLASNFAMSRPAVSKHLAVLRRAGLVHERKQGRENVYALDRAALVQAGEWLSEFWRGKLGALKRMAERHDE